MWNRSPAQVGCIRQVLRAGVLGRPRGMGWGGRRSGGLGWGTHVNPWLIHVNVWQNPLQYCKVISLQLVKLNEKKSILPIFVPKLSSFYGHLIGNLYLSVSYVILDYLYEYASFRFFFFFNSMSFFWFRMGGKMIGTNPSSNDITFLGWHVP